MGDTKAPRSGAGPSSHSPIDMSDGIRYIEHMTTTYRIKGINSDHDTCALCGKVNLKKVVWLAALDADGAEDEAAAYGTDCAGRLLYGSKTRGNGNLAAFYGKGIELARRWLAAGHPVDVVCKGVWNRVGFSCDVRNGMFGYWGPAPVGGRSTFVAAFAV